MVAHGGVGYGGVKEKELDFIFNIRPLDDWWWAEGKILMGCGWLWGNIK